MEQLKMGDDNETITLRFTEQVEANVCSENFIKRCFRPGQNDTSQKLTNEEINKINEIICLGNKITKGYEYEENNSGCGYNAEAVISFEPGKDYEITKSEFESLRKVFWLVENFLAMNKKIEFEFADSRKPKIHPGVTLSGAVKQLLQDNSIEIDTDENGTEMITFEAKKKYYFIPEGIKLLNGIFEMDKAYPYLTSECIHKNIFDMPLEILQSFTSGYGNLNYQEYIFKERAEKNSETKKNGISYNLWAELVAIKTEYKKAKEIMEALNLYEKSQNLKINEDVNEIKKIIEQYDFNEIDEDKLVETIRNPNQLGEYFVNKIAGKIGGIIKTCGFHEIKSQDRLLELIKNPAKFDKYFINETANKINTKIKKYGFTEIQSENQLFQAFQSVVDKETLRAQDIKIILIKIKESLNEAMLKEALNVIIKNILEGYLVNEELMNSVEIFLSDNSDFDFCNLETILKKYIKPENVQSALTELKNLRDDKLKIYEALDKMTGSEILDINLKVNEEIQVAIKKIVDSKSSSVSHEHVIKLLKKIQISDVSLDFVNTILENNTTTDDEKSIKMRTNNMDCIIGAVQKYKLDIEDKNPLKNIMRLFFKSDRIDKINTEAISDKINDMLTEQIYTEMLNKRPALLFFIDIDFLYKKIIVDPNNNVFKKTFYDIPEHVYNDAKRFSGQGEETNAQYFNSLLNRIYQNNEYDFDGDRYCYYFVSFIANNIKKFDNPSAMLGLFCMFISRLNYDFLYERIFSGDNNSEIKNPIKNLLGMLFENGEPSYFAENYLCVSFHDDIDFNIVFGNDKNKINNIKDYCEYYLVYWAVIAYILSNLEYKPEYKNNFLYFFDLFNWNMKSIDRSDYNAWLKLFNFVDPVFLFGNLDVIERYLTCCKKNEWLLSNEIHATIKTICDYDNYKDYAVEPKLNETDYFYTLLIYNERCIDYFKPKMVFDHLKDEDMKNYYQWIRDNAKSKVNGMYEYIKEKKYDNPEQQKQDILLLIEIFPDAMSQYIDAEFLIYNWDTLDLNFKEKCTKKDGLNHFFIVLTKLVI